MVDVDETIHTEQQWLMIACTISTITTSEAAEHYIFSRGLVLCQQSLQIMITQLQILRYKHMATSYDFIAAPQLLSDIIERGFCVETEIGLYMSKICLSNRNKLVTLSCVSELLTSLLALSVSYPQVIIH